MGFLMADDLRQIHRRVVDSRWQAAYSGPEQACAEPASRQLQMSAQAGASCLSFPTGSNRSSPSLARSVRVRQMHETRQSKKGSDHVPANVQRMRRREVAGLRQAVQQVPPHPLRYVQRSPIGVQGLQTREVRVQRDFYSRSVAINPGGRRSDSGQESR
jgi:hypothetical protein